MVVRIVNLVEGADTTEQGDLVLAAMRSALDSSVDPIDVSFAGISTATSSFVNASFVRLLDYYSFAEIKRRLRVISSTRTINDQIRSAMERAAKAHV